MSRFARSASASGLSFRAASAEGFTAWAGESRTQRRHDSARCRCISHGSTTRSASPRCWLQPATEHAESAATPKRAMEVVMSGDRMFALDAQIASEPYVFADVLARLEPRD